MSQIGATVSIVAKEGRADELAALLERLHAEVSAEPGCELYSVLRNDRNDDEFMVIEIYQDRDALKAHQNNDRLGPISAGLPDLAVAIDVKIGALITGDHGHRK